MSKQVLCIDPSWGCELLGGQYENEGLGCIAAAAQQIGYQVQISHPPLQDIAEEALIQQGAKADIVAISAMTWNAPTAIRITQAIRRRNPNVRIAIGGPGPTDMPDYFEPFFNLVLRGEGELVFQQWLNGDIADGVHTARRDLNWDGSLRPLRDKTIVANGRVSGLWPISESKQVVIGITYTRGCPYDCSFCSAPNMWQRRVTRRPPSNVVDELLELSQVYGANSASFSDVTFNTAPSLVIALCEELIRRNIKNLYCLYALLDPNVRSSSTIQPTTMFEMMREAGFVKVAFGLESPASLDRREWNKPGSADQEKSAENVQKAFSAAHGAGLAIRAFLMIGAPFQDETSISQINKALQEYPIHDPRIAIYTPLPGTPDWSKWQEGVFDTDWSHFDTNHLVFEHPTWSPEVLYGIRAQLLQDFFASRTYQARKAELARQDPRFDACFPEFEKRLLAGIKD